MTTLRTFVYTCVLLLSSFAGTLSAQTDNATPADTTATRVPRIRGIQYESREEAAAALRKRKDPLFAGVSVSGDVVGAAMTAFAPYGQLEGACRINLKNRYFPIAEIGWGMSDHRDDLTDIHFKTQAPYFRIGCDYNVANDKFSGNRIFVGLRYAFSSYTYDLDGPAVVDPVWGTETPYVFTGVNGSAQWGEVVVGLEAKIWKIFHLGWSFRYRIRLQETKTSLGQIWYIPGYGKNDGHALGGTFNIIFDI